MGVGVRIPPRALISRYAVSTACLNSVGSWLAISRSCSARRCSPNRRAWLSCTCFRLKARRPRCAQSRVHVHQAAIELVDLHDRCPSAVGGFAAVVTLKVVRKLQTSWEKPTVITRSASYDGPFVIGQTVGEPPAVAATASSDSRPTGPVGPD